MDIPNQLQHTNNNRLVLNRGVSSDDGYLILSYHFPKPLALDFNLNSKYSEGGTTYYVGPMREELNKKDALVYIESKWDRLRSVPAKMTNVIFAKTCFWKDGVTDRAEVLTASEFSAIKEALESVKPKEYSTFEELFDDCLPNYDYY